MTPLFTANDVRRTLLDAMGGENIVSPSGREMVDAIVTWATTPEADLIDGMVATNLRTIVRWLNVSAAALDVMAHRAKAERRRRG